VCFESFWQINIRDDHRELTAFTVPSTHYEFNKLPLGLSNSPSSFQRLVDIVLKNLVAIYRHVYLDDVIFKRAQEHAQRLEDVLHRFGRANLQLNPDKCVIAQPQVIYLRYVISEKEVSATPDKVKAVRDCPTPKNVVSVRAFFGPASFYSRLVQDFATITKPLTEFTKNDRQFLWGSSQQKTFDNMKRNSSRLNFVSRTK